MRILVFSEVFWPEDFIVNDLVREWAAAGHAVEVVTQYPSYPASYVFDGYKNEGTMTEDWEGVAIHRFHFIEGYRDSVTKKLRNYYSFVNGGKRIVDTLPGDFDCVFVSQTGPLTVAYPALYYKKKYGVPVNIWTCDIWPDAVWSYGIPKNFISANFLDRMIKSIYDGCDHVFVSSKYFAQTIGTYSEVNCTYAPNWLRPTNNKKSALRLPAGTFHFTFTGNVSRYQNLINTVAGFQAAKLMNAQLNIVGDGSYLAEVKAWAERNHVSGVVFHGRRPYNEMYDILSQSDALVLPLISHEGIEKTEPFKIQSYLQAGKPILGILNGAGREIIEENNLGLCVSPDDVNEIAEGFQRMVPLVQDPKNDVSAAASNLMKTRFNKQEIVKRITNHLVVK